MKNVELLKKQHLSYFKYKKEAHKNSVLELYKKYFSAQKETEENKLFSGFYDFFANGFSAEIYDRELIVGTGWHWKWAAKIKDMPVPHNHGHFIIDFKRFLELGIEGKIRELEENSASRQALIAFSKYIRKYENAANKLLESASAEDSSRLEMIADDCKYISENAPKTFRQALQFVWFTMCFLNLEASEAGISLGRVDSYLYPYYKNDIEKGILTPDDAFELIVCFYIKLSECDESCMLTVGGNIENELTIMFLEAQAYIDMRQPSVSLRVSDKTSDNALESATKLVLKGSGMPAYFNDDVIVRGLKQIGISKEDAEDYAVVGCYESAPQGVFANTVAAFFNLYDSFNEFIGAKKEYGSFDDFLNDYKQFFKEYYKNTLLPCFNVRADYDINLSCPFTKCLFKNNKYVFGINILGIGVLIDSIYTVKKLVFDEKITTIEYLKKQADEDFEDANLYEKISMLKTAYGSNEHESNIIAHELTRYIGETILSFSMGDDVIVSPALFWFTQDIHRRSNAGSINGRKQGELLSYGVMPCATPHKNSITSVLMSCGQISSEYFPNGCPVMISLDKTDIKKEGVLKGMIKTYFGAGGAHLAVNIADADTLKNAKKSPMEYPDLMVKISGYSAKFTSLEENIQDAIIERANK